MNVLRFEWLAQGLRIFSVKLKPESLVKSFERNFIEVSAATDRGNIVLRHSDGFTKITIKKWLFPVLSVNGRESAIAGEVLVNKICTANKI